jgi:hypothetical protein
MEGTRGTNGTSPAGSAARPRHVFTRYSGLVHRTYTGALLEAVVAVQRGVPIDTFLRRRKEHYWQFAPQDLRPLPKAVSIVAGEIVVEEAGGTGRNDVYPESGDFEQLTKRRGLDERSRDLERSLARRLPLLDDRVARAETAVERLRGEVPAVEGRLLTLEAALEAEVATGVSAPGGAGEGYPKRMGGILRRISPSWLGAWTLMLGVLVVEAYQFALPYLDRIGVDSADVAKAWAVNSQGVLAGFGFAGAATAMLFALSMLLVDTVHSLWAESYSLWRATGKATLATVFLAVISLTAIGIGSMRHDLSAMSIGLLDLTDAPITTGAPNPAAGGGLAEGTTFVLLTLVLPLAMACLHLKMRLRGTGWRAAEDAHRRAIEVTDAAHANYLRHEAVIRPWRERRDALRAQLEVGEHALVAAKEARADAISEFETTMTAMRDALREALANERRAMVAFVAEAVAALELDRYAFTKAARRRYRYLLSADAARDLPAPRGANGCAESATPLM